MQVNDSNGDPFTVTVNVDSSTISVDDNQVNISGVIDDLDNFSNFTVSAMVKPIIVFYIFTELMIFNICR